MMARRMLRGRRSDEVLARVRLCLLSACEGLVEAAAFFSSSFFTFY